MLVPMYFLIDIWGHENRHYAAVKFFLFTQLSGLLMLLAILGLYFVHGRATGVYTLRLPAAARHGRVAGRGRCWLMLGFFVGLRGQAAGRAAAHVAAGRPHRGPDGRQRHPGGLLLKTGAYGLLRFVAAALPAGGACSSPRSAMVAGRRSASCTARCWPSPRPT